MDRRINLIKWRRHPNGKYFGYYDTKEEAWELVVSLAKKYRHSRPGQHTIRSLCEDCKEQGIIIHETVLSRWFKDIFRLTIRSERKLHPVKDRRIKIPIEEDLYPHYMKLDPRIRKWYLNRWLRVNSGLGIPEVIVYFVENNDKDNPTPVLFFIDTDEDVCKAMYIGSLGIPTKKLIESLCIDGDAHGLEYIKRKCEVLGYYSLGAND